MADVDVNEAMSLSTKAWESWQTRRIKYFLVPVAFLVPAAVIAVIRSPDSDVMGILMLVFFGLGFLSLIWVKMQMPLSPPRVKAMAEQGWLSPNHVERLRRQAAR